MITPGVGFIVYGVHKDGLKDPMGKPFIDSQVIRNSKNALTKSGVRLVNHGAVVATKEEAVTAMRSMKEDPRVDAVVLFSGTWVWAAHMIGALRDFATSGKGLLLWTHPGSQGWRPVGGFVLHGGLLEVGIPHRFVYGDASDPETIAKILSYAQASCLKKQLNLATLGAFGGRGMGQT